MSKKALSVIIAVTAAVTLVSFGSMMVVSPNSSMSEYADKVFEEAKKRQETPLVSVSAPLKTDVEAMTDEDIMADKVASLLSSDPDFIDKISESTTPNVKDDLSTWLDEYKNDIASAVASTGDEYLANAEKIISDRENSTRDYADKKLAEEKSYIDSQIEELGNRISAVGQNSTSYMDSQIAALKTTLDNNSRIATQAIDDNNSETTAYVDSTKEELNAYIDNAINEVKAYVDALLMQAEEYINSRLAELPQVQETAIPEINIHREMPLFDDSVVADAHAGYAMLSFPSSISSSDIAYGVDVFKSEYPEVSDYAAFTNSGNVVFATYPMTISEDDINYGLDLIENLLSTFVLPEPESDDSIAAPVVIEAPIAEDAEATESQKAIDDSVIEEAPAPIKEEKTEEIQPSEPAISNDFTLERAIPFNEGNIEISANKDRALFSFPASVSDSDINSMVSMLISAYPVETASFGFAAINRELTVSYDREHTEEEVNSYIDFLIDFYSYMDIYVHRKISLYGSSIVVDAYADKATVSLPSFVSNSEIESGIATIKSTYPDDTKAFVFTINGNSVDIEYPAVSSKEELEYYVDVLEALLKDYINSFGVAIPKAPTFKDVERSLDSTTVEKPSISVDRVIVPSAPRIFAANPVFPEPKDDIEEEDIPSVRNSIRNIEVQRYLELLK